MLNFRTKSGSIYQVDEPNKLVRCVIRPRSTAPASRGGSRRLPPGGAWVDYVDILHDGAGSRLRIHFSDDANDVVTSEIVEVVALSDD